ncbi:MAG: flagellar basal body rod protein FlgB [Syntrophaceae bacterium]|nr:flagellar basal body rod protein FlgB [Syntrophaceae bacterium]
MMEKFLFDKNFTLLSDMLDYRTKRHQLITSNIANLDTPGFRPSDLVFERELDKQRRKLRLTETHPKHMQPKGRGDIPYELVTSTEGVKLDHEMANLAENNMLHNTSIEMLVRKFQGLDTVLKEVK